MVFILSIGFLIEYFKGTRTIGFVLPIILTGVLAVMSGTIFFIKNPLSRYVRYTTFCGFFVMYIFYLMTATTSVTFTFMFPLLTLFCMYLDRWFMFIVNSLILLLNGVYIVQKFNETDKQVMGAAAYDQFTTTMLIHVIVLILFMSSLLAVEYIFNRLKRAMDYKIQEAFDAQLTEQRLLLHATIDELTGVFNRRHFLEKVREQLNENSLQLSLLLLDIDDFKLVNDTYGHLAGDQVLIRFSELLKETCPEQAIIGRVGGEEFAVFLTSVTEEESREVAERIRATYERSRIWINEETPVIVTVSGGLAYNRRSDIIFKELFQQADQALYVSKNGKNKITWADS